MPSESWEQGLRPDCVAYARGLQPLDEVCAANAGREGFPVCTEPAI